VLTKVTGFFATAHGSEAGRSSTSGAVVEGLPSEEADTADGVLMKATGFAATAHGSEAGRSLLLSELVVTMLL